MQQNGPIFFLVGGLSLLALPSQATFAPAGASAVTAPANPAMANVLPTTNPGVNPGTNPTMNGLSNNPQGTSSIKPATPVNPSAPGMNSQVLNGSATGNSTLNNNFRPFSYDSSRVQVQSQQNGQMVLQGTVNSQAEADTLLQNARAANASANIINNVRVQSTGQ